MTLIGHSLGAYFSTVYALRYPQRVHKLVLLSPAGVPRDPNATVPSREMLDRQVTGEDGAVMADNSRVAALEQEQQAEKRKESFGRRVFTHLWEGGWSPFQVVRSSLFWGPMLVGKVCFSSHMIASSAADYVDIKYSARRFGALNKDDTRDMHDYIMNITLSKGSGEYCICQSHYPIPYPNSRVTQRTYSLLVPMRACP